MFDEECVTYWQALALDKVLCKEFQRFNHSIDRAYLSKSMSQKKVTPVGAAGRAFDYIPAFG